MPIYDYKKSQRVGYREVAVPASRVVIIEGIYALAERLRGFLDLRVSITGIRRKQKTRNRPANQQVAFILIWSREF